MPAADLAGYRAYLAATTDCASVNEYLERFELPLQVMQDAEALTRVTRELVEDLADRGTAYAEIRLSDSWGIPVQKIEYTAPLVH